MAHDDQTMAGRLGSGAFGTLAMEVVSVLKARQAAAPADREQPYARAVLDKRITSRAPFNPTEILSELRALRLSDDSIIGRYIPDAARTVGARWVANEMGFAEVTIASARLQSLLTEVAISDPEAGVHMDCPFDLLIVACEKEQHTLGCFVTAAQLRRRGAMVETLCSEPSDVISSRILDADYDAVLFSCSRSQDLESIREIIHCCHQQMSAPPAFVLGGIVLNSVGNLRRLTGVDLISDDVDTVVTFCEQRSIRSLELAAR